MILTELLWRGMIGNPELLIEVKPKIEMVPNPARLTVWGFFLMLMGLAKIFHKLFGVLKLKLLELRQLV